MGLDIAFDRDWAIAEGLKVVVQRRGSDAEIDEAQARCNDGVGDYWDESYVEYLKSTRTYIEVPNTDGMLVEDGGVNQIIVRANKWGNVYEPLTTWLKAKGIEWTEF